MIFHSLGRHPLAGLAAAFAGVSGGYSANLLLGTVDPLLSGITEAAAHLLDPAYSVGPEVNWYFMFVSTFVISIAGAFITEKIVEPRLGPYSNDMASIDLGEQKMDKPSAAEMRGLKAAGWAFLAVVLILAMTVTPGVDFPGFGILLNPETGKIGGSPFLKGIVGNVYLRMIQVIGNKKSAHEDIFQVNV